MEAALSGKPFDFLGLKHLPHEVWKIQISEDVTARGAEAMTDAILAPRPPTCEYLSALPC
jgi:hypothetical protein